LTILKENFFLISFSLCLTLSTISTSHSGRVRSNLTIFNDPCSTAYINAVDPSESCELTAAPLPNNNSTKSAFPCLTASINAV